MNAKSLIRIFCVTAVLCAAVGGCNVSDETRAITAEADPRKVWVFVQLNVPEEDGVEDYYYYARVSQSIYERIKANDIASGFLFLDDVRYYGNDEKYHYYADEDEAGELVFRIEDIRKIDLLKKAPKVEVEIEGESTEPAASDDKSVEKKS
jgi:hypothetical protein